MKIAVSASKGMVAQIFNFSESFEIFDTKTSKKDIVENSFDGHRFVADYMDIKGVNAVIGTNMGIDLYNSLRDYDIKVYEGKCLGSDEAIKLLLDNKLEILVPQEKYDDCNNKGCSCHR